MATKHKQLRPEFQGFGSRNAVGDVKALAWFRRAPIGLALGYENDDAYGRTRGDRQSALKGANSPRGSANGRGTGPPEAGAVDVRLAGWSSPPTGDEVSGFCNGAFPGLPFALRAPAEPGKARPPGKKREVQERFFHGCCYLLLYVICGGAALVVAAFERGGGWNAGAHRRTPGIGRRPGFAATAASVATTA